MFDAEEIAILNALENDTLVRSVDADEEMALACKAATDHLTTGTSICDRENST